MNSSSGKIGASLQALSKRYEILSHNLANANTVGFKKRRSVFAQKLAQKEAQFAETEGAKQTALEGTSVIDFTQGHLTRTGRSLDLALNGDGFFMIETPDGPLYTRNGSFQIDPKGQLVDHSGRIVSGSNGPLVLPANTSPSQVRVSAEGELFAGGVSMGRLQIVEFEDREQVKPVGQNVFLAPEDAETKPAEQASVQQGYREASNVSVVEEMVDLISVSRLYEANLKSIGKEDDQMKHILDVAMS